MIKNPRDFGEKIAFSEGLYGTFPFKDVLSPVLFTTNSNHFEYAVRIGMNWNILCKPYIDLITDLPNIYKICFEADVLQQGVVFLRNEFLLHFTWSKFSEVKSLKTKWIARVRFQARILKYHLDSQFFIIYGLILTSSVWFFRLKYAN